MKGYYDTLIEVLKRNGYRYKGPGKGSHEKWIGPAGVILVPFNCYSRHTANAVLKQAGIDQKV